MPLEKREQKATETESELSIEELYRNTLEKLRSISILVVEDNLINQKVILAILKKYRIFTDVAENGIIAIEKMSKKYYDLVFMDVQMPEMDGLETSKNIRLKDSSVLNHDIKIIAMTAHSLEEDRQDCLKSGMDDYLPKPIDIKKLLELLSKFY